MAERLRIDQSFDRLEHQHHGGTEASECGAQGVRDHGAHPATGRGQGGRRGTPGGRPTGQGGQPAPPVTAAVGLEYKFSAFGHESFLRGDYEYQGKAKWPSPGQDPGSLQYDDANYTLPATNFVTTRFGMTFGDWQVAAFIDNLFDSRTVTNYNYSINPFTAAPGVNSATTRLERDWTFRPRTFGLTFTYRH